MNQAEVCGIVGDGQLGRMMAIAAGELMIPIVCLGTTPNSPTAQIKGVRQVFGDVASQAAINEFAEHCGFMTWELEEINARALQNLAEWGFRVDPSPFSLETMQNKYLQKLHYQKHRLPIGPFRKIYNEATILDLPNTFRNGVVVKRERGSYDGYGNHILKPNETPDDVIKALKVDSPDQLYAEAFVPYRKELAFLAGRALNGQVAAYPIVETEQKDGICNIVTTPVADVDPRIIQQAIDLGHATLDTFDGAGMIAVEIFLTEDDKLLINESARRVHNSGHYSIDGAITSQFSQHLRAITGRPLGDTAMKAPAAVMVNILGRLDEGEFDARQLKALNKRDPEHLFAHWYGKTLRPGRKLGHITLLGDNVVELRARGMQLRDAFAA